VAYQLKAMDMWFRTLPGALVVDMELKELDRFLPAIPGQIAIQIGGPSNLRLLQKSNMRHVYYCSDQPAWMGDGTRLQCDFSALPFDSDSVNLIILTHALSFVDEPIKLLEEIYRVLKPGGQLILLGFNRFSWWSVVRRKRKQIGYPWMGQFYSIRQVKRWLSQCGYGLIVNKSFCFFPPLKKRPSSKWINLGEVLGQVFIPKMGAVHLVYAQKKVAGANPLVKLLAEKIKPVHRIGMTTTNLRHHEKN
jgi:SAM-dependent methyltransferase